MSDEASFRKWYAELSGRMGLNPDPDDPNHYYDYRALNRAVESGQVEDPATGGHMPSTFKVVGHPREILPDRQGRLFDTVTSNYLTGGAVPQQELTASERTASIPERVIDMFGGSVSDLLGRPVAPPFPNALVRASLNNRERQRRAARTLLRGVAK